MMTGAAFFSPKSENLFSKDGYGAALALLKLLAVKLRELEEKMISEMQALSPGQSHKTIDSVECLK